MKSSLDHFKMSKFAAFASALALACASQAMATSITGDTITTNNFYIGGSTDNVNFKYSPSGTDSDISTFYFDQDRPEGRFYWRDNLAATANQKMILGYDNVLTLYKHDTVSTTGMTLDPNTGKIDLKGTVGAGLFSGSTPIITLASATSANMTVSNLTVSSDSVISGLRIGKGLGGIATNSAIGFNALGSNTSGADNSASGASALTANNTGGRNTAQGSGALYSNTLGSGNSAIGAGALFYNTGLASPSTVGWNNTAIGDSAGAWYGATGTNQLNNASYSIYIGAGARGATASDLNTIVIGATAVSKGSNTTVIGTPATVETHLAGTTKTSGLDVSGATTLNGPVTLAAPQGDISMGIYSN